MRTIKFRGKRVDNGEWVYGSLILCGNAIIRWVHNPLTSDYTDCEVNPSTVGQLWNPSHGIEVYGGDLVTALCAPSGSGVKKERICLIKDTNTGFGIAVWHRGEWCSYSIMDFTSIKVIGNITDNPELLK